MDLIGFSRFILPVLSGAAPSYRAPAVVAGPAGLAATM